MVSQFMQVIIKFPKLLVGAINGPGVGVGATIVPHFDIAYASDTAFFYTPFTQLCVTPEFCSSYTFPRILGPMLAHEMLYLGRRLSATEAKQAGFVNEIIPAGDGFVERVLDRLKAVLEYPNSMRSFILFKRLEKTDEHLGMLLEIHKREMALLDERSIGETSEAAQAVAIMQSSKKKKPPSKL